MPRTGPAFYDDDAVFATYMSARERQENPNDTLEKPILLEMIGELTGQRILDLGCGDAAFGREALNAGCGRYVGVEGSRNMLEAARSMLAGTAGEAIEARIEEWSYPEAAFDLVVSRLALHYVEDFAAVCASVYHTLADTGRFLFSVEHPVITSSDQAWRNGGPRQAWIVDDYFETGPRVTNWLGGEVVKYHRTVEDYFATLQQAGFVVESLRESRPRRELFAGVETYERRKRIPLFLLLAAVKR